MKLKKQSHTSTWLNLRNIMFKGKTEVAKLQNNCFLLIKSRKAGKLNNTL